MRLSRTALFYDSLLWRCQILRFFFCSNISPTERSQGHPIELDHGFFSPFWWTRLRLEGEPYEICSLCELNRHKILFTKHTDFGVYLCRRGRRVSLWYGLAIFHSTRFLFFTWPDDVRVGVLATNEMILSLCAFPGWSVEAPAAMGNACLYSFA